MTGSDWVFCLAGNLWGCLWPCTRVEWAAMGGFKTYASCGQGRNTHPYARPFTWSKAVGQILLQFFPDDEFYWQYKQSGRAIYMGHATWFVYILGLSDIRFFHFARVMSDLPIKTELHHGKMLWIYRRWRGLIIHCNRIVKMLYSIKWV